MGKRHQASRRKAYGRRQHELRERFDRPPPSAGEPIRVEVFQTDAYDDTQDPFATFDLAVAVSSRYAIHD